MDSEVSIERTALKRGDLLIYRYQEMVATGVVLKRELRGCETYGFVEMEWFVGYSSDTSVVRCGFNSWSFVERDEGCFEVIGESR